MFCPYGSHAVDSRWIYIYARDAMAWLVSKSRLARTRTSWNRIKIRKSSHWDNNNDTYSETTRRRRWWWHKSSNASIMATSCHNHPWDEPIQSLIHGRKKSYHQIIICLTNWTSPSAYRAMETRRFDVRKECLLRLWRDERTFGIGLTISRSVQMVLSLHEYDSLDESNFHHPEWRESHFSQIDTTVEKVEILKQYLDWPYLACRDSRGKSYSSPVDRSWFGLQCYRTRPYGTFDCGASWTERSWHFSQRHFLHLQMSWPTASIKHMGAQVVWMYTSGRGIAPSLCRRKIPSRISTRTRTQSLRAYTNPMIVGASTRGSVITTFQCTKYPISGNEVNWELALAMAWQSMDIVYKIQADERQVKKVWNQSTNIYAQRLVLFYYQVAVKCFSLSSVVCVSHKGDY